MLISFQYVRIYFYVYNILHVCVVYFVISGFFYRTSHHLFGNLICLSIDSYMSEDAYKERMCSATRNFLFDNSPNATFTMDLPEVPLL